MTDKVFSWPPYDFTSLNSIGSEAASSFVTPDVGDLWTGGAVSDRLGGVGPAYNDITSPWGKYEDMSTPSLHKLGENGMLADANDMQWSGGKGLQPDPSSVNRSSTEASNLADMTDSKNACNSCCLKRLIITVERHTAVMLEDKSWWGIVGTMTAKIVYQMSPEYNAAHISEEELPFTTPTFEQKGPPTHTAEIKRAIMPGKYQIQAIPVRLHATYGFNTVAGIPSHRGMNIFGNGGGYSPLNTNRGIDIHVGGNATYTTGCIIAAPGLVYHGTDKDQRKAILKKLGVTSVGPKDFTPTKPTWSAYASLKKITEMVEMIEDFKKVPRGGLPIRKALTCIDIVVKNPPDNTFTDVVVLESPTTTISKRITMSSVKIISENEYQVTASDGKSRGFARSIKEEKVIKGKKRMVGNTGYTITPIN